MRRLNAPFVYVTSEAFSGMFFYMMGVAFSPYLILDAGLGPFRLLMLGTALEITVLLFEVPTGVLADSVSRRASIIVGYLIQGFGFVIMGLSESFPLIVLSQVMWGLGHTFRSGADVAWITDEVGEKVAAPLYVRAAQAWQALALVGIALGTFLLTIDLGLPIVLAGALHVVLGVWMIFVMPETRQRPEKLAPMKMVTATFTTFRTALRAVKLHPVLLLIFAVAAFDGLSSEGLDRLFGLHFVDEIGFPSLGGVDRVVWWGIIDGGGLILAIAAAEYVRRNVDLTSHREAGRALMWIYVALIVTVVAFGMMSTFALALGTFWLIVLLREVADPIFTAWVNQGLDSESRATVNSMWSQVGALGEASGGPTLGWFASARGVPSALVLTGLLRAPALLLFARALRRGSVGTLPPEEIQPVKPEPGPIEVGVDGPE